MSGEGGVFKENNIFRPGKSRKQLSLWAWKGFYTKKFPFVQ